jgi:outer membrane lipoprotein-sorting protein
VTVPHLLVRTCRPRSSRRLAVAAAFATALAAFTGTALADDAGATLSQLMQRLAKRHHGHATFIERQFIAILDRPLESSGELFYDAPDRLEKRTLAPKAESLVLDKGTLSVQRGTRRYALALKDYPQVAPFIDSIRATLAGDLAALEHTYAVSYEGGAGGWTLVLVPQEAKLAALIARIRMTGSEGVISEFTVERADGDRSVMTIRELPGP